MKKLLKPLLIPAIAVLAVGSVIIVDNMNKDHQQTPTQESVVEIKQPEVKKEVVAEAPAVEATPVEQPIIEEVAPQPTNLSVDEVRIAILPAIKDTEDLYILQTLRFSYASIERAVMNTYVSNPTPFTKEATPEIVRSCLKQLNATIGQLKAEGKTYDYRTGICTV